VIKSKENFFDFIIVMIYIFRCFGFFKLFSFLAMTVSMNIALPQIAAIAPRQSKLFFLGMAKRPEEALAVT
jgi:hypothetical protein